jgi:hypothetical protein
VKHKDTRDLLVLLLASTVWRVSRWLRRTDGPSVERWMRCGGADEDSTRPKWCGIYLDLKNRGLEKSHDFTIVKG